MLLDSEKNGVGPKRLTRAVAFLEAADVVERHATRDKDGRPHRAWQIAADELRDMAVRERMAHDAEPPSNDDVHELEQHNLRYGKLPPA